MINKLWSYRYLLVTLSTAVILMNFPFAKSLKSAGITFQKQSMTSDFLITRCRYLWMNRRSKSSFSANLSARDDTDRNKRVNIYRLERIISNRGAGSRKEVAAMIGKGRVSVDGNLVKSTKRKFRADVRIEIDGMSIPDVPLLAAYHKPLGVHSTMGDPWGRLNLEDIVQKYPFLKSMHPVGRLDADTTGLLLFSSNGQLTQHLLHPSSAVPRVYKAVVTATCAVDSSAADSACATSTSRSTSSSTSRSTSSSTSSSTNAFTQLRSKLAGGIETTDGIFTAKLLDARPIDRSPELIKSAEHLRMRGGECEDVSATVVSSAGTSTVSSSGRVTSCESGDGNSSSSSSDSNDDPVFSCLTLQVTEGKYRMVRRILHNAGHSVVQLHRVSYGHIHLHSLAPSTDVEAGSQTESDFAARAIPEGEVWCCTDDEIEWAENVLAGLKEMKKQKKKK